MRVIFVVPWGERLGGAEQKLMTILRYVDRERIDPTVVFLGDGPWVHEVRALGIPAEVFPSGRLRQPLRFARTVVAITRSLRRRRPDVVIAWSAKTHLYVGPASLLSGLRRRALWWQLNIPTGEWIDRLATLVPARAVACSSGAAAKGQSALWPRRQTLVVQPGVSQPVLPPAEDVAALRKRLGIPAERVVIGIVGRLQPWKRQDLVLRATAILLDGGLDVHALIVGGTPYGFSLEYPAALDRLANELGIADRIAFTGQVADPTVYLAAMDVFVLATAAEPFGLVLLEAMAMGRAVVAYDAGGPAEIVEQGVSGVLIPESGPAGLAQAIAPLSLDPAFRERLGEGGRRRWLQRFTAEKMVERLSNALEELIAVERA